MNKDTSQTHLRIGHLSIKEHDPDYVALAIANDILRRQLVPEPFNDVRTKRGLAYSVGSRLNVGMHDQGVWLMRAEPVAFHPGGHQPVRRQHGTNAHGVSHQ